MNNEKQALKRFKIISQQGGVIDLVSADYIAPTNAGFALYVYADHGNYENDKLVYAVPVGCGAEELPQKDEKITVADLLKAYRKGRIFLRV
jgi:hypothetical protein